MKFNGILPTLSKAFLLINRNANLIMRHRVKTLLCECNENCSKLIF